MKNDHTYEYRVFTNRLVDVGPMEVGNCTKKVVENLKSKDKVDGRFFHTSDTNEWFFCWNGKLQELNLAGDASVNEALEEVRELIKKADAAVGLANDAADAAGKAAEDATSAVESIKGKADQDYVDAVKQDVESLEQEVSKKANQTAVEELAQKVSKKANQTAVEELAQKVESKASISDLNNKANKSDLKGLATEQWVTDQKYLTQHQDISHLASTTYVDGKVASIEIPSVEGLATKQEVAAVVVGYATETWVSDQGFLTEHQDISGKQDKIDDIDDIRSGAAAGATALQSIPEEYVTETELIDKGYLNEETLSTSGTIVEINKQIGEINNMITAAIKTTNTILDIKEE